MHPAPGLKPEAAAVPVSRTEQRPVTALRGVGAALAEKLARLNVTRVADLLFVLPLRYEDRTHVTAIGALIPGVRAAVEGEVQLTEVAYRRRRQLLTRLSDGSGFLTLRFFYFSGSQQQNLARGTRLRAFGEVRRGPLGLEIVHPEYRRLSEAAAPLEARGERRTDPAQRRHRAAAGIRARRRRIGTLRRVAQPRCSTHSTSICAPRGSWATPTVERAG